jgi:hypothetical protein
MTVHTIHVTQKANIDLYGVKGAADEVFGVGRFHPLEKALYLSAFFGTAS